MMAVIKIILYSSLQLLVIVSLLKEIKCFVEIIDGISHRNNVIMEIQLGVLTAREIKDIHALIIPIDCQVVLLFVEIRE